jgi:hypothetical protein
MLNPLLMTPLASPAPTATSWEISDAQADLFAIGDVVGLAAETVLRTAAQMTLSAKITSISNSATPGQKVITVSPALSAAPAAAAGAVKLLYANALWTDGGISIESQTEVVGHTVDQVANTVLTTVDKQGVMLKAPLATVSARTIALGFNGPQVNVSASNTVTIGGATNQNYYAAIVDVKQGQIIMMPKVGPNQATATIQKNKTEKSLLQLELECLFDAEFVTNLAGGEVLSIKDKLTPSAFVGFPAHV